MTTPFLGGGTQGIGGVQGQGVTQFEEGVAETLIISRLLGGSDLIALSQPIALSAGLGSVWPELINVILSVSSTSEGLFDGEEPVYLNEGMRCNAAILQNRVAFKSLADSLAALSASAGGRGFFETLQSDLELGAATEVHRGLPESLATELFLAVQTELARASLVSLTQSIELSADLLGQIAINLFEQFDLTAAEQTEQLLRILEKIGVQSTFLPNAYVNRVVADSFSLNDLLKLTWELLAADSLTLGGEPFGFGERLAVISESLRQSDSTITQQVASEILALSILIHDEALRFFAREAGDAIALDAVLATSLTALAVLLDQITKAATVSASGTFTLALTDKTALSESPSHNANQQVSLHDRIRLATIHISIDGEEYLGWTLNTANHAVTNYDHYNFNSLTRFGQRYLGAAETGIYELGGDDDASAYIHAHIRSGAHTLGSNQLKRIERAYLGFRSDGGLILKLVTGEKTERWYELTQTDSGIHEARIKVGKGAKALYWQFELTNKDGSDFDIDRLELVPIELSRRVRR